MGKSSLLAAIGPSGSGKTHTVFGCAREPGMVPLALRRIFCENESSGTESSRVFYLSMFEISSEKGKAERMIDLLHDGGDVCMQNSILKGLQEAVFRDAQQAESLIAHGMLKRATAMTNLNSQSSRSQCIINIRYDSENGDEEVDRKTSSTTLTIVDLAGAEREKKTGNQGARLLESNFINNTSMVFGLCLRSLLEHQKNRKKPLQKHYQNSLLTRYLRDYLEGKKRMMLILTVKPGEEDYLNTSFLLRQASPFTKIKFKTLEQPVNLTCSKRPNQALPQADQLKKMKFSNCDASLVDEGNIDTGFHLNMRKEIAGKVVKDCPNQNIKGSANENSNEIHVLSDGYISWGIQEKPSLNGDYLKNKVAKDREYLIMQGLSKALWSVLKQYKKKLEGIEIENCHLRDSLTSEKTKSLDLENELASEKLRCFDLENELKELKFRCTCCNEASANVLAVLHDAGSNLSQYQMVEGQEVNTEVSSYSLSELEQTENEKKMDHSATDSIVTFASDSGGVEEQCPQLIHQQLEDLSKGSDDSEYVNGFKDTSIGDACSRSQEVSTSNDAQDLICYEETGMVAISSTSGATSPCLYTGQKSEQDAVSIVGDVKKLEPEIECVSNESSPATSIEGEMGMVAISSTTGATSPCLYTGQKSEEDAVSIVGDVKKLEPEIECVSNESSPATSIEGERAKSSQDYEDLKDAEGEPTKTENDDSLPSVENRIACVAAQPHTVLDSSESPRKDCICFDVDEEQLNYEEGKKQQVPLVTNLPKEEWDTNNITKCLSHLASSSNFQHKEKPKRRLLPASCLLVKDISTLDVKDENDKPKGARGGKRVTMDDKIRTQGICGNICELKSLKSLHSCIQAIVLHRTHFMQKFSY
ncbi:Kinesin-like protein [Handroanthus impetiginosus]|uniref:Kinesin-like protein n=1 Tax=Handroanthus impetiginosus TaxID=429701 RepID=A0A2G9HIM4_9LAMI|nr:Kinesin-like protein [Handroanthus impetiginosus]